MDIATGVDRKTSLFWPPAQPPKDIEASQRLCLCKQQQRNKTIFLCIFYFYDFNGQ